MRQDQDRYCKLWDQDQDFSYEDPDTGPKLMSGILLPLLYVK